MRGAPHGSAGGLGAGADHSRAPPRSCSHTLDTLSESRLQRASAPARTLPEPYTPPPIACAHSFHAAAATSLHGGPVSCVPRAYKTPTAHRSACLRCCALSPHACTHPRAPQHYTFTIYTLHSHNLSHTFHRLRLGGDGEGPSGSFKTRGKNIRKDAKTNGPLGVHEQSAT